MQTQEEFTVEEIKDRVQVVVLCVIEQERVAIEKAFGVAGSIIDNSSGGSVSVYSYAEVEDVHRRKWGIAIGQLKGQGNNAAYGATFRALQAFKPEWIVLCGIAGAAPEDEFSLGDVYLATHIHDLSVSAALEGGRKTYRPSGGRIGLYAEDVINSLPKLKHRIHGWNDSESVNCERPQIRIPLDIADSQLYGSDDWKSSALSSLLRNFSGNNREQKPKVVSGAAFSNNTLTKDTELIRLWREFAKDASTVEMELAGVHDALHNFGEQTTGLLSVRGISDIVGVKRSVDWLTYAAATAASFTKHFIRGGLLEVQRLSAPTSNEKDFQWTSKLPSYVEVIQFLDEISFKTAFRQFSELMEQVCELHSSLRSHLNSGSPTHLCEFLVNLVLSENNKSRRFPLYGAPGSGKTSMLAMLALATRRLVLEREQSPKPFVDYVNLHELDEIRGESAVDVRAKVESRLAAVISHLENECKIDGAVLFLDGFDLHLRDKVPDTQKKFIREIEKLAGLKVVGIGKYEDHERKHPKREMHAETVPFDERDFLIRFHSLKVDEASNLCKSFIEFHDTLKRSFPSWDYLAVDVNELDSRLLQSELRRVDLLRLDIIATVDEQHATPFSSALETYVRKRIEKRLRRSTDSPNDDVALEMRNVADCLYRIWVLGEKDPDSKYSIECWGLLTGHPVIRSFFHAYYVIATLEAIGIAVEKANEADREEVATTAYRQALLENKLFPAETNVHCKWLVNEERQSVVLLAIKTLLSASTIEPYAKTHLCYLVGRIDGHKRQITEMLKDFYASVGFEAVFSEGKLDTHTQATKEHYRMLQCTLLISQARLAKPDEQTQISRVFIDAMRDKEWAGVALGFHLMYYGDAWFFHDFAERPHDHQDPVVISYLRVLEEFEERILLACNNPKSMYPSFDIEVAIICLLAMSRQQREDLNWRGQQSHCRDIVRKLLEKVSKTDRSDVKRRPVFPLVKLAAVFIKRSVNTSVFSLLTKLFECKYDTQRAGWIKQLGIAGRIESVADHSWSAMILAEAILPEACPE